MLLVYLIFEHIKHDSIIFCLYCCIYMKLICSRYIYMHYQWIAASPWFSVSSPLSSTNRTDCYYITEILLKVALNTIILLLYTITVLLSLSILVNCSSPEYKWNICPWTLWNQQSIIYFSFVKIFLFQIVLSCLISALFLKLCPVMIWFVTEFHFQVFFTNYMYYVPV